MPSIPSTCSRSWSICEDSLRRYVFHASKNFIQDLLPASDSNMDGWKVVGVENGVEVSRRRSGSLHTFVAGGCSSLSHPSSSSQLLMQLMLTCCQGWSKLTIRSDDHDYSKKLM